MAEPTVDAIMADVEATLKAQLAPALATRVTYPPPEGPISQLSVWLDYGPVEDSASQFAEQHHTVTATVAIPLPGNAYPWCYREVTAVAQRVRWAMRANTVVAGEATIESVVQNRAFGAEYPPGSSIVAATVVWRLETKADLFNEMEA